MDSDGSGPFGYTFSNDYYNGPPTAFTNGGPPLLNENEAQCLDDFFSNTDPYHAEPLRFPVDSDTKGNMEDFNWGYVPPPTIHQVSTTIADQARLHRAFDADNNFASDPFSNPHLTNTQDDYQAASTLYNNAQPSHMDGRSYSVPGMLTSGLQNNMPLVPTANGLFHEQLAAILPNHSETGSIDATVAAQFGPLQQLPHVPELDAFRERSKSQLRRTITYGTDNNFNSSGFTAPSTHETDETATRRLLHGMHHADPLSRPSIPAPSQFKRSSSGQVDFPVGLVELNSDNEDQSDGETSEDYDDDRPTKKRRMGNSRSSTGADKSQTSPRKSVSTATGKGRKGSVMDASGKKKRPSTAGQKRENLSEEQKRNNHILSEQKRRNLIKRGFEDLNALVPELRNGGLSKSAILMESAHFLDTVILDNKRYEAIGASPND
ncbi:hypothetical protein EJ04DRAFT_566322 [Polyplosphaeria fusca]|uniref:BHLH domain-containing protein n=1 Tax=Polyplosphaeria fusca TaxID=682080 RepID=A0A9P4QQS6_9PLEO|nr:hypothetical protein EJ04DRAFT_566322 [Polyplosphaeria fusca]